MSVWMVETLIATTLLMALVMLLRRPVAHWLGAGAAYCLWAVPFARMLLPTLPGSVASPSPLHVAVDQAGLPGLLTLKPTEHVASDAGFPWLEAGIGIWFAGILAFLILQAVGYARFRRHMLMDATSLWQEGRIRLITSPHASGPLAFGVFRPFIVLPADFALRYDPLEQEMAIAHERAHHAHGDLTANMVALALLAIHWCNPVAWIAYRAYRADQETACDARVLALYGRDQAHVYGRAILKAAGGRQFAAACHLTRITTLKGRLIMLSHHDISLHRISWGMAAVACLTATGLALTASGSRAAQQIAAISDSVETANFARLSNLVAQPAVASVRQAADVQPTAPAAATIDTERAAATPPESAAPIAPAADMVAPVPSMPAVPPVSTYQEEGVATHIDARIERHHIPTDAEIRRMVPRVDVRDGCESNQTVSKGESIDGDGRRIIRVRICKAQIATQAHRAARAGLVAARAQMARAGHMTDRIRADMLRDLDDEIARMDGQGE